MKDGKYRCIGMNVLDRPMYDLNICTIRPSLLPAAATERTHGRSMTLAASCSVGTDYPVARSHRSQTPSQHPRPADSVGFKRRICHFPKLVFLSPLAARTDHWTEVQTESSKGIMCDVDGSSLVLVTHRPDIEMEQMESKPLNFLKTADIRQYAWTKNSHPIDGVWRVKTSDSHDIVFRSDQPIAYASADSIAFTGTAGIIRHRTSGTTEMAIFHGSQITADGLDYSHYPILMKSVAIPSAVFRKIDRHLRPVLPLRTAGPN